MTGCSWDVAARFSPASETTLRRRRDEWVTGGVFDALAAEALAGYDRIVGLDLSAVSIDGSLHKAPCGGEGTGPNPTDRGKLGWKWSIASDRDGIPIGWAVDGANRHDIPLLAPTLDAVGSRGLLRDVQTVHLDRGYDADTVRAALAASGITDAVIARKRRRGEATLPYSSRYGSGCAGPSNAPTRGCPTSVNSARNTDRSTAHRLAQLALAITLIITIKLTDWAERWSP